MSEWEQTTLGEVTKFIAGKYVPKDAYVPDGPYWIYGSNSVMGKFDRALVQDRHVIMAAVGAYAGATRYSQEPSWINNNAFAVIPTSEALSAEYLAIWFDAEFDLASVIAGTGQPYVKKPLLAGQPITLPPLPEQRRIVDLIASVDAERNSIRVAADRVQGLLDSLRSDIFSRSTDRRPFSQVATLQRGFDLPVQDRESGTVPVIASNGQVGWHSTAAVSGPGVITGRSGTIGKVMLVGGDYWPLNTTLFVKDFKDSVPAFVRHLLAAMDLPAHAGGSTVPSLNRNVLDRVEVYCPDSHEQRIVASALDAVDALSDALAHEASTLGEHRARLASALLSQHVEIPESYDALLDGAPEVSA